MHKQIASIAGQRCPLALIAVGLLCTTLQPSALLAQAGATRSTAGTTDTTHQRFFTYRDAVLAGVFAGATILMIPLDRRIALRLQDSSTQANHLFKQAANGAELITSPGAYIIGGSLYAIGTVGHFGRLADLGWHGTEAILFADGVTFLVKGTVGRARPYLSTGHDPDVFRFGKGFRSGDWTSFPSGHTSTAFAAAAAVTNETTVWWPKSTWIIGPLMYGGATGVGLSRMYHSKHWGSDVVIGAAIGTFSGRKVWQYAHGNPGNRLDRIMLRTSVIPDGHGGAMLAYSLPVP